jgi:hypothetical protein
MKTLFAKMVIGIDGRHGISSHEEEPHRRNYDRYIKENSRTTPLLLAEYFVKDDLVHGEYKRYDKEEKIIEHHFMVDGISEENLLKDTSGEMAFHLSLVHGRQWFFKENF